MQETYLACQRTEVAKLRVSLALVGRLHNQSLPRVRALQAGKLRVEQLEVELSDRDRQIVKLQELVQHADQENDVLMTTLEMADERCDSSSTRSENHQSMFPLCEGWFLLWARLVWRRAHMVILTALHVVHDNWKPAWKTL